MTYGQTDIQIPPVFFRTLSPPVPSGAAAQKGKEKKVSDSAIDFSSRMNPEPFPFWVAALEGTRGGKV